MTDFIPIVFEGDDEEKSDKSVLIWTKVGFMIFAFFEALISGAFPTYNRNCRESPKIMGIANAFAGGVFLAIAFCHITPEQIESWGEIQGEPEKLFPLPEVLILTGYSIILLIDKVVFDTHALFDGDGHTHDPAEVKFENKLRASMTKANQHAADGDVRSSRVEQKEGM